MNSGFNQALSNTAKKLELSLMLDMIKSDMFLAQRGLLITSFAHDTERYAKHKEEFAARSRR
ncbi:MAG: hypothetical protein QOJ99_929 [Bryobacterales bacterium]|jgi:hypothetical protein|nr:hypothetical protein [Bryobacterales bacterium]